jgi:cytosine deaminase
MTAPVASPSMLDNARLPRWLLPAGWPQHDGVPVLARIAIEAGRVQSVRPAPSDDAAPANAWNLAGTLALPGFVDAHTHLDKAFTLPRMKRVQPGLLGAIDAMLADRVHWTPADVRDRATRGLQWAWECGTTHVRTHVDWWEPESLPMAWPVMAELAREWAGKVRLEQVSLIKLPLFEDAAQAMRLAKQVKATGPHALLGGFVHSTNWSENALRNLLVAAQACDLDIDLHVDEELNAAAVGLQATARILREIGYEGRVVCGHICALAAQPEAQAFATLDAVARAPITVVSLPATNLLLQDAVTGRTPRQRGITLVKEARERGIPLLFASDNVQEPHAPRLHPPAPLPALPELDRDQRAARPREHRHRAAGRRHRAARPAPALLGRQRDLRRRDGQGAGEAAGRRARLRPGAHHLRQVGRAPALPRHHDADRHHAAPP